jgi:hypothetical protein
MGGASTAAAAADLLGTLRRGSDDEACDQVVELFGEIFADASRDRMTAARKALAYLQAGHDPALLIDAARRLVFLKGDDPHDYKFSSAVLEDYDHASPQWRERLLASSLLLLPGSADRDNDLVKRTRAALQA